MQSAWMPWSTQRSIKDAADQSAYWVEQQAREQQATPLLLTETQTTWRDGPDAIRRLSRAYPCATARQPPGPRSVGPVLVFMPDITLLEMAARYARGSSLCVIEAPDVPMRGWAIEAAALDLSTGSATPDDRPDDIVQDLEFLLFKGNNGWTSSAPTRDITKQMLPNMLEHVPADRITGFMLARGCPGGSVQQLADLIAKIAD